MYRNLPFSHRSISQIVASVLLLIVFGCVTAWSQATEKARPLLEFEGNKVFSKQELLATADKCLDRAFEGAHKYTSEQLDYCLHKVTQLMWTRGYLQAKLKTSRVEETADRQRVVLAVSEGPLYRVGEMKIEG